MGRIVCWLLSTSPSDAREGSEHGPLRACSPEVQMGEKRQGWQENMAEQRGGWSWEWGQLCEAWGRLSPPQRPSSAQLSDLPLYKPRP